MAWTQTDLDVVEQAIASGRGAKRIEFSDQTIEFHSIPEMLELRAVMKRELGAGGVRLASSSKGLF